MRTWSSRLFFLRYLLSQVSQEKGLKSGSIVEITEARGGGGGGSGLLYT